MLSVSKECEVGHYPVQVSILSHSVDFSGVCLRDGREDGQDHGHKFSELSTISGNVDQSLQQSLVELFPDGGYRV
jgi:hypothetical protein